jgi:hypothetical protein
MSRELYKAELVSGRVTEWTKDGRIARYTRRYQVLKNPTDDPNLAVQAASRTLFAGLYRSFTLWKQPAPYANMNQASCTITEDESSHGTRVWVDQVFVISSQDQEAG